MRIIIFGVSLILALAIGLPCAAFLFDPLNRSVPYLWIAVTDVGTLRSDGTPEEFPLVVPRRDAWMLKPDLIARNVFLRRVPESGEVVALNSTTEPMGLPVDYDAEQREFRDCCWKLKFDLNGKVKQALRSEHLSALETKIDNGMVLVRWMVM